MSNTDRIYFVKPAIGKEQIMKTLQSCTLALAFTLSTTVLAAGPGGMATDQMNQGGSAHGGMGSMGNMGATQSGAMAPGNMQGGGTMPGMADATAQGLIRKVDKSAKKLTIKHGPLPNLGMGAMTMVYKVKNPAMLEQVKAGDKVDFVAESVNGVLTVTKIEGVK